jgi:L-seryl-tRNA(Ser) seleniumtransferase
LKDEAVSQIPIWRMIASSPERMQERALAWRQALGCGEILPGESTVGGGSLPGETLPTFLLALPARSPNRLMAQLRRVRPAIIARLQADRVLLDPRTVLPEQEDDLLAGVKQALSD